MQRVVTVDVARSTLARAGRTHAERDRGWGADDVFPSDLPMMHATAIDRRTVAEIVIRGSAA